MQNDREWRVVADEMAESIEETWPSSLCSTEAAATVGVKLTPEALRCRFKRLAKARWPVRDARARAIRILSQAGQIASPPDGMTLWQFFKPSENVLINKGSLAAKEKALAAGKKRRRSDAHAAKKKSKSAAPAPPPPTRPPPSNRPPPINIPTEDVADDAATPPTETAPTDTLEGLMQSEQRVCLSGLKRGLAGGVENGQGRGGKIQHATKVGIRDLVVADHVPVRDVPKVLVDAQVILAQQRPEANEIITHSHIADWICELGAEELYDDWAEFWSVRREFGPLIVLQRLQQKQRPPPRKLALDSGQTGRSLTATRSCRWSLKRSRQQRSGKGRGRNSIRAVLRCSRELLAPVLVRGRRRTLAGTLKYMHRSKQGGRSKRCISGRRWNESV